MTIRPLDFFFFLLQMGDNNGATPAHNPSQQLYPPHPTAQPALYPPAPSPYPYGWPQQPHPYGYQWAQNAEAQGPAPPPVATPQGPAKKRALDAPDADDDGPPPAKMAVTGRGRGKNPGILWGWQKMGYYEDKPPLPSCQAHRMKGCSACYRYISTKK